MYDVGDKLYDVRYNVYDVCGKTRAEADNVYDVREKMSAEGVPVVLEGVQTRGEGDIVGFYYFPGCGIPITALKTAILLGGCFEFLFFASNFIRKAGTVCVNVSMILNPPLQHIFY